MYLSAQCHLECEGVHNTLRKYTRPYKCISYVFILHLYIVDMNYMIPCPHSMALLPNVAFIGTYLETVFLILWSSYCQISFDDLIITFSFFLELASSIIKGSHVISFFEAVEGT